MDKINCRDVYAKTFLNEIKENIKKNYCDLCGELELETDKKMLKVIKDLFVKTRTDLEKQDEYIVKILPTNTEEESERIMCTLMIYYMALYNDNLDLLDELLSKGYKFGTHHNYLSIYVLDKKLSSKFDKELYIKLLLEQDVIEKFCQSNLIQHVESIDEIINKFCRILNKNPYAAVTESKLRDRRDGIISVDDILTKNTLAFFDEEVILQATDKQKKEIIDYFPSHHKFTEEERIRINNLMLNHNFSIHIYGLWKTLLNEFTDEELIKINEFNINLLQKHFNINDCSVDYGKVRKEINNYLIQEPSKKTNFLKRIRRLN